jgi:cytoskeletal protein RodZ
MFSQYTWGDFFKFMSSATVVYYAVVGWVFYRGRIQNFLTRQPTNGTTDTTIKQEDEDQDAGNDLNRFFDVTDYQSSEPQPPQPEPEQPASKEPEKKSQEDPQPSTASTVQSTAEKPKKKRAARKTKPDPNAATTPKKEVDLAGAPLIGDLNMENLLIPLTGAVIPQSEQFMEHIISAAQELEKTKMGAVMATASASEGALQLAEVINGQKIAFPSGFNFSRKQ